MNGGAKLESSSVARSSQVLFLGGEVEVKKKYNTGKYQVLAGVFTWLFSPTKGSRGANSSKDVSLSQYIKR
jgi:hypothetical protein